METKVLEKSNQFLTENDPQELVGFGVSNRYFLSTAVLKSPIYHIVW